MSWTPDIPKPDDYIEYTNNSGITFYLPTDAALANVPYSFQVFAGSIDKDQIIDEEGLFVRVDGSRAMTGDFDAGSQNIVNANDVGAATATVSGQATMGSAVVEDEAVEDVKSVRNITTSRNEPPVDGGVDGDIWIQYEVE
jgi:hypothetical protein